MTTETTPVRGRGRGSVHPAKAETEQTILQHQSGYVVVIDDHGAWWQSIDPLGRQYSTGATVEPAAPLEAAPGQPPVQVAGTGRT